MVVPLCDAGKDKELRLLTRGQQVTIRAKGDPGPGLDLEDVRIVDSGPSTARVVTLTELDRAMKTPAEQEKYKEIDVLMREKLLEPGSKGSTDLWTIADPAGTPVLRVRVAGLGFSAYRTELEARKPGDVVTLLASPTAYDGQWFLDNARIVTEPPSGVQLHPSQSSSELLRSNPRRRRPHQRTGVTPHSLQQ